MDRPVKWFDYFTINISWLSLSTITNTMTPLVVPLLVQQFVGDQVKGQYFGTLRLWTLMAALLVQAFMGTVSDHSTLPWGRRRPFILLGSILSLIVIALVGFSADVSGFNGYYLLVLLIILLAASSNTAQAALQGLIPDLVPSNLRGRFSGIKAILEIPIPLILVSLTIAKMVSRGDLWAALATAMGIVVICAAITMLVSEQRLTSRLEPLDWRPFVRLLLMTAIFTGIIIGTGWMVQAAGRLITRVDSPTAFYGLLVMFGLIGMFAAIALGVFISVRVGLGKPGRENPSFKWWIVNRLAFLVGINNLASFTVYFLQARLGFVRETAAGPASILTLFVGFFVLISAVPSGWLADRFGHRRLVAIGSVMAACGTAVAISIPSLPVIYFGGILIGGGTGLFFAANWALGTKLIPENRAGQYLGIANLAGAGAGAIGAYLGGPIADLVGRRFPSTPEMGYLLLFAIYGLMFLISLLALRNVRVPQTVDEPVQT
jgi:MFS family permease